MFTFPNILKEFGDDFHFDTLLDVKYNYFTLLSIDVLALYSESQFSNLVVMIMRLV